MQVSDEYVETNHLSLGRRVGGICDVAKIAGIHS